jgi:tetratricopeptide (TPR) repeat protein
MSREYRKREEENELIKRFEDHLRKRKTEFFDLDAYEEIIDFYMTRGKHNRALQAVNLAIQQYPFSTELMTVKAQVLSSLEEYDQALELLEQAHAFQPNDPEIYLTIGSIYSLQGNFQEAIENYEKALTFADDKDEV